MGHCHVETIESIKILLAVLLIEHLPDASMEATIRPVLGLGYNFSNRLIKPTNVFSTF